MGRLKVRSANKTLNRIPSLGSLRSSIRVNRDYNNIQQDRTFKSDKYGKGDGLWTDVNESKSRNYSEYHLSLKSTLDFMIDAVDHPSMESLTRPHYNITRNDVPILIQFFSILGQDELQKCMQYAGIDPRDSLEAPTFTKSEYFTSIRKLDEDQNSSVHSMSPSCTSDSAFFNSDPSSSKRLDYDEIHYKYVTHELDASNTEFKDSHLPLARSCQIVDRTKENLFRKHFHNDDVEENIQSKIHTSGKRQLSSFQSNTRTESTLLTHTSFPRYMDNDDLEGPTERVSEISAHCFDSCSVFDSINETNRLKACETDFNNKIQSLTNDLPLAIVGPNANSAEEKSHQQHVLGNKEEKELQSTIYTQGERGLSSSHNTIKVDPEMSFYPCFPTHLDPANLDDDMGRILENHGQSITEKRNSRLKDNENDNDYMYHRNSHDQEHSGHKKLHINRVDEVVYARDRVHQADSPNTCRYEAFPYLKDNEKDMDITRNRTSHDQVHTEHKKFHINRTDEVVYARDRVHQADSLNTCRYEAFPYLKDNENDMDISRNRTSHDQEYSGHKKRHINRTDEAVYVWDKMPQADSPNIYRYEVFPYLKHNEKGTDITCNRTSHDQEYSEHKKCHINQEGEAVYAWGRVHQADSPNIYRNKSFPYLKDNENDTDITCNRTSHDQEYSRHTNININQKDEAVYAWDRMHQADSLNIYRYEAFPYLKDNENDTDFTCYRTSHGQVYPRHRKSYFGQEDEEAYPWDRSHQADTSIICRYKPFTFPYINFPVTNFSGDGFSQHKNVGAIDDYSEGYRGHDYCKPYDKTGQFQEHLSQKRIETYYKQQEDALDSRWNESGRGQVNDMTRGTTKPLRIDCSVRDVSTSTLLKPSTNSQLIQEQQFEPIRHAMSSYHVSDDVTNKNTLIPDAANVCRSNCKDYTYNQNTEEEENNYLLNINVHADTEHPIKSDESVSTIIERSDADDSERNVPFIVYLILVALYVIIGMFVFEHLSPHETLTDGLYFTVVMLTTIGFGDILPGPEDYLALVFYGFLGLALANFVTNKVIESILDTIDSINNLGEGDEDEDDEYE